MSDRSTFRRRLIHFGARATAAGFGLLLVVTPGLVELPRAGERAGQAQAEDVYSPGGWATLHRSPANRKLAAAPAEGFADAYGVWTALEGAAVLTAPTMSPDGRTLYVTTGQGPGASNLHAFSIDGDLLWQAPAYTGPRQGIDGCAILSSPIVDREGDVFVSDCNQLFAYHGDGRLSWKIDLPLPTEEDWEAAPGLDVNAFTTAVFTKEGHLLGVTNFGDVVLVDRRTGASLSAPFRMPGHVPPPSPTPMPKTLFHDGLVDPALRAWSWQLLWGGSMRSANTPAVDLESGRIFVAATAETPGAGALYGLDIVPATQGDAPFQIEIAFSTEMGPGSGSSPALSPDGQSVYVSDEEGAFYAVDARSGVVRWQVPTRAASAAAAVGADGTVYALQAYGPALIAIAPDGEVRWESDLEDMARAQLPRSWILGRPEATGNGNPTVVGEHILVPVVYGYATRLGRRVPWPVTSSLMAIDARTGRGVRDVVALADDSTGITAFLPDGTIVNSLGTALTSGIRDLHRLEGLLPGDRRLLRAVGGIQVSRPAAPTANR